MPAVNTASLLPPGVVVLERGWLSSNNVVLRGRDGAALVDSGYASHAEQTVALISAALQGEPLKDLLNTHLHSDHCGGNAALQAAYPSVVTSIPPGQASAVAAWDTEALTYAPTGQACPRFSHDRVLLPGSEVRLGELQWQVHAAPGHDPHSVILFEPLSGCLISADALWEHGFGVVFPELEGQRAFDDVAATLDLIEQLAPQVVIPGHGAVFRDVAGALSRARSRLQAYVSSPSRHAAHAAKVLLKFKLLEVQETALNQCLEWAAATRYFTMVHARWFSDSRLKPWLHGLLEQLERSGAVEIRDGKVRNT